MDGVSERKADIVEEVEKVTEAIGGIKEIDKSYKKLYEELQKEIAERKRDETLLEQSEERFRLLYENSPLGYQSLDSSGCMREVNPAWLELLGYERDEVIGRSFGDFVTREELFAERFPKFKKKGRTHGADFQMVRKDGRLVDVEIDGKVAYNADGTFRQTHCVLHDVTERKEGERERESLLRTIEAKNKELQSILYVASHDLKSPLVNIAGFAEELKSHCEELIEMTGKAAVCDEDTERLGVLLNDYIPESLGFINKGTERMRLLIDGLLQVSRVGSSELEIATLDMNKLMAEVVGSIFFQAKEAGVTISVDDLPKCVGDFSKTSQIFSNLVDNAAKYLDPARKGEIRISGYLNDRQSVYCVEDNGKGIAPEYQQRVFEIFHRLDPADSVEGEGLGLTIVMRIADRQGGRVWLESQSGKGSSFFVSLPSTV